MTGPKSGLIALPALAVMLFVLGGASPPAKLLRNLKLTSVSVDVPQDFEQLFPEGPDVESVNTNCRACHSPSMVMVQPRLSKAVWEKEVAKMITTYHAPIPEGEVPKIVNYLSSIKN
ncbi:cytochrome c [Novosphingobium sp.]|uniref:cytochrome c n=1 Tax=Novosphingobium sp. TaxID=1874826 RepID=UPI0025DAB16E|nr:cytochrome c [Novosphingobium sp.]